MPGTLPSRGCAVCGEPIAVQKRWGRLRAYCTTRCRRKRERELRKLDRELRRISRPPRPRVPHHARWREPRVPIPVEDARECVRCGRVFDSLGRPLSRHRFCSPACRHMWTKRGRPPHVAAPQSRSCDCCGVRFDFLAYPGSRRRFCSPMCGATAAYRAWRRRQGATAAEGPPTLVPTDCQRCGSPLPPRRSGGGRPRRYCSTACRHGNRSGAPLRPLPLLDECLWCRAPILRSQKRRRPAFLYCDRDCRYAANREVTRLRRQVFALREDRAQAKRAMGNAPQGDAGTLGARVAELGRLLALCIERLAVLAPRAPRSTDDKETP
jgi:hypothetical protein